MLVHEGLRVGAVQLTVIEVLVLLTSSATGRSGMASRKGERQSWAVRICVKGEKYREKVVEKRWE